MIDFCQRSCTALFEIFAIEIPHIVVTGEAYTVGKGADSSAVPDVAIDLRPVTDICSPTAGVRAAAFNFDTTIGL